MIPAEISWPRRAFVGVDGRGLPSMGSPKMGQKRVGPEPGMVVQLIVQSPLHLLRVMHMGRIFRLS